MINITALLVLGLLIAGPPIEAGNPIGYWINPAQSVVVEISKCGDEILCGHVRWASDKATKDARSNGTDPLEGTELLHGFTPEGAGRWKGRLFVPDLRKRSSAELRMINDRQLKIVGCAVGRLLCKSQVWTQVDPAALPSGN